VFISKPFTDYTADDYATVVGVNLTGFFTLTQRAIGEMLKRGSGHIVNITTTLADYADSSTPSVLTSLTKGGLASATKSLAIEYASRGIRVNAVSPGIIQMPVHPAESYAGLGGQLPPVGHVGQVRDIVDGILFLESSLFITGEVLHIDGGQIAGHYGPPTIGPLASSGCRALLRRQGRLRRKHTRIQRSTPSRCGCPTSGSSIAGRPGHRRRAEARDSRRPTPGIGLALHVQLCFTQVLDSCSSRGDR
jgi:hypothetical protein